MYLQHFKLCLLVCILLLCSYNYTCLLSARVGICPFQGMCTQLGFIPFLHSRTPLTIPFPVHIHQTPKSKFFHLFPVQPYHPNPIYSNPSQPLKPPSPKPITKYLFQIELNLRPCQTANPLANVHAPRQTRSRIRTTSAQTQAEQPWMPHPPIVRASFLSLPILV